MKTRKQEDDLLQLILKEHSLSNTKKVLRSVGVNKAKFAILLKSTCGYDKVLAQRAAWAFGHMEVCEQKLLHPHFKTLVSTLSKPAIHPAVNRNILRLLQNYPIPEKYQAQLFDICMAFLLKESEPTAIRVFAMSTAANIASGFSELKQELNLVLLELMNHPQSAGLVSRAKKVMRQTAS